VASPRPILPATPRMGSRRAVRRYLNGCFQEQTGLSGFDCLDRSRRGESDHRERLLASEAEVIEATIPQEPAMDTKNGRDNSPPEGEKPIIDQMTDLAAQAAGSLAETAVKAGAKKAKKAVARRLPELRKPERNPERPKPPLNPELRKLGLGQKRQSRKPPRSLRRDQQKPVNQRLDVGPSARKRPPKLPRKRQGGGEAPDRQAGETRLEARTIATSIVHSRKPLRGPIGRNAWDKSKCPLSRASRLVGFRPPEPAD
jgi:hypothetical protein